MGKRDTAWSAALLANGIRTLREHRGLTQAGLAEAIGTTQSAIARMENPAYRGWSVRTLLKIAVALRARLRVRVEPRERAASRGVAAPESKEDV